MDASQQEKAMTMNDPKTLGREDGIGKAMAADRTETVDRITTRASEPRASRASEGGHPAPEALAGWLAA